jgi:hypothetical protein
VSILTVQTNFLVSARRISATGSFRFSVKGKLLKSLSMSRAVAGAVFQRKGWINSTIISAK